MAVKEKFLTNERLRGKFRTNFDLTNYAIYLAREKLKSGEECSLSNILDGIAKATPEELALAEEKIA